jgi:hypothetical protein
MAVAWVHYFFARLPAKNLRNPIIRSNQQRSFASKVDFGENEFRVS